MNRKTLFHAIFLAGVFISAVSQVMLKKATAKQHSTFLKQYLNPLVVAAYMMFFGTTLLNTITYREVPLSIGMVLETTSYLYVTFFGVFLFNEKISIRKLVAIGCIVSGSIVCALLG